MTGIEAEHDETPNFDLHHLIELTCHSILSGPLDNISESFKVLGQSQLILLTRLKFIQESLLKFRELSIEEGQIVEENEVTSNTQIIKGLRGRLQVVNSTLLKIEKRIEQMKLAMDDIESKA